MAALIKMILNMRMLQAKEGIANLERHVSNIRKFNVPVIVALNQFSTNTESEISLVGKCYELNVDVALSEVFEKRRRRHRAVKLVQLIDKQNHNFHICTS